MNDENLIPFNKRSESEQRRIRSMGGKARAKKIADANSIKQIFEMYSNSATSEEIQNAFENVGFIADTKLKALIAKAIALGMSKDARLVDILNLIQMIAKYTGQEPVQAFRLEDKPQINIDIPKK